MIDTTIRNELLKQVEQLSAELQRKVLDFAVALVQSVPKGTPGKELLRFAGLLDSQDAREMIDAIEKGCEQVDTNEW